MFKQGSILSLVLVILLVFFVSLLRFPTLGYAPGPPACGSTISSNTVLDGNVGPCSGNGFTIGADNTVLDCAGYRISGGSTGYGVRAIGRNNVTIKNCNITGFQYGISISGNGNAIDNNTVNSAQYYGLVLVGDFNNITNNTLRPTRGTGLLQNGGTNNIFLNNSAYAQIYGFALSGFNSTLSQNKISGARYNLYITGDQIDYYLHNIDSTNLVGSKPIYYYRDAIEIGTVPSDAGMVIAVNSFGPVMNNLVLINNSYGILLINTKYAFITGSTISKNYVGIELWNSTLVTLNHSSILNSTTNGVILISSTNNMLSLSGIKYNNVGVLMDPFSGNNTLSSNNVDWNGYGIEVESSDNKLINNTANYNSIGAGDEYGIHLNFTTGNNLTMNTASYNNIYGIWVDSSPNSFLINNTANWQSGGIKYGIYLYNSTYVTLINNTVMSNYYGINSISDSTQLFDNIATNNTNGITIGNGNLTGNKAYNNKYNLQIAPDTLTGTLDTTNLANNKPVYFYVDNPSVGAVPSGAGMVLARNCSGMIIDGLVVSNNSVSVNLYNVSNSYVTNNVMNSDSTSIRVNGTNVTVFNNTANAYTGVSLSSGQGNTIANNSITGFGTRGGIALFQSTSNNIIENNTLTGSVSNSYGIYLQSTNSYNNISFNKITATRYGIYFYSGSSQVNRITNNTIANNTGYGVYIWGAGTWNVIANNTFTNNSNGVVTDNTNANYNTIANNTLTDSISIFGGDNNVIDNNVLTGGGISATTVKHINITNNVMSNGNGFFMTTFSPSYYSLSYVTNNTVDGKKVYYVKSAANQVYNLTTAPNASTFYCYACNNVDFRDIDLSGNGAGLVLIGNKNVTVINTTIHDNYNNGIRLISTGSNISINYNNIYNNTGQLYKEFSGMNLTYNWWGMSPPRCIDFSGITCSICSSDLDPWLCSAIVPDQPIPDSCGPPSCSNDGPTNATNVPASVLIAPLYTSSSSNASADNARITLTNVGNETETIHAFFVAGSGDCTVADVYICLISGQTMSFLASDFDPDIKGHIIFVVVDSNGFANGHNSLIGSVEFKRSTGHYGSYNMVGFRSVSGSAGIDNGDGTGTIFFDDTNLERWPDGILVPEFPSNADGNSNKLVIMSPMSDLTGGGGSGSISFQGTLYNDTGGIAPFSFSKNACYSDNLLSNSFLVTSPLLDTMVPSNHTGWMRFYSAGNPILGVYMDYNQNQTSTAFSGGRVLPGFCSSGTCPDVSITYPVFPPSC